MRKIKLGYYVNTSNHNRYFYVLALSHKNMEFNPEHTAAEGNARAFRYYGGTGGAKYQIMLHAAETQQGRFTWGNHHYLDAQYKIHLILRNYNGMLMTLGEKRFDALVEGVMAYNIKYNNNSEIEEDLYIERFPNRTALERHAIAEGVAFP